MKVIEVRHRTGSDYKLTVETPAGTTVIAGYGCTRGIRYVDQIGRNQYIDFPTKQDGTPSRINRKVVKVIADEYGVHVFAGGGHKEESTQYEIAIGGWVEGVEYEYELTPKQVKKLDALELWANFHYAQLPEPA